MNNLVKVMLEMCTSIYWNSIVSEQTLFDVAVYKLAKTLFKES